MVVSAPRFPPLGTDVEGSRRGKRASGPLEVVVAGEDEPVGIVGWASRLCSCVALCVVCLSSRPVPAGLSNQEGMLRRQGGHDQGPDCNGPLGIAPHPAT